MKKGWLFTILITVALCLTLSVSAFASNRVTEIAVDVTLEADGSAYIVQTWSGIFDEGTECYFPVTNLGEMTLSDLQVSDEEGIYTFLDTWDTGASFDKKARKCGLNRVDGGFEVCWGISVYGEKRYAVEYRLDGLVAGYDDADGFLFQFVPSGMNTGPTDVTVQVHLADGTALSEEKAGIWGFGFNGQVGFTEDGSVLAYTETPINSDNSVILLLRLNQGLLSPTRKVSGSFEDLKGRAFEGSDYAEEDDDSVGLIAFFAIVIGAALLIWMGGKERRQVKKLYKTEDYWREAPIGGNLEASYVMARRFYQADDDGNIITAVLTRMIATECLEPLTEVNAGFMGREKKSISLRLIKPPSYGEPTANLLYMLLSEAAGSDGILQEKELEHYCITNYTALMNIIQEAKRDGSETLHGIGCYQSHTSETLNGLSDRGRQLLSQLIGYKKYLLDFSLIAERGVDEAVIWQDCLTFAALFGIADKVMEQMRKIYPTNVNAYTQRMETAYYVAYRYTGVTYLAARNAESAAKRASGGGGHSSLGGGGGFSGGGHGGGTR